jgi:hypothetical protein
MKTFHRAAVGATAALTVLVPAGAVYAAAGSSSSNQPAAGQNAPAPASPDNWQKVHDKLLSDLQARVQTLAKLTSSVNNDKTLSPQDRATLSGLLSNETTGIDQLLATVQAATPQNTTIAQLRADAKEMVDNYRVYLVMSRQVHLTEAADRQTTAETKIESKESKIQAAVIKAGSPPNAVQAYNDLVHQVANATQATGEAHIPAVLAVTPQGYPGDGQPLTAARTALGQANTDLKAAKGDLATIRNVLKQHDDPNNPSPATSPSGSSSSGASSQ